MNYTTTEDIQGICAPCWHVPADEEWCALLQYLDPETVCSGEGSDLAGGKMKEKRWEHWETPNTGATNESGFTALGAGYCAENDSFVFLTNIAHFWSSSEYSSMCAISYSLYWNHADAFREKYCLHNKASRFSVRCLKDL